MKPNAIERKQPNALRARLCGGRNVFLHGESGGPIIRSAGTPLGRLALGHIRRQAGASFLHSRDGILARLYARHMPIAGRRRELSLALVVDQGRLFAAASNAMRLTYLRNTKMQNEIRENGQLNIVITNVTASNEQIDQLKEHIATGIGAANNPATIKLSRSSPKGNAYTVTFSVRGPRHFDISSVGDWLHSIGVVGWDIEAQHGERH